MNKFQMNKFQIYTRKGDKGETSLANGIRFAKDDLRIDAIGEIDELSAALGIVRSIDNSQPFCQTIHRVQNELIRLMSELASVDDNRYKISQSDIKRLETDIDSASELLPEFKAFIVAGDNFQSSFLHLARTICRRAERSLVKLNNVKGGVSPLALVYMNRLSDLLFVLSRCCDAV
ncbi:MAG: cob(I)yrinic acid a,c-diamide adenosyltransferase [Planctomycetaceae bacterium]|jgi:cob(I)alamin adenosyltransferase|nr:cob(I)yrinic acid a,c-diamide adenosyltransferase [Planctomycetaceae bacterium]